MPCAAHPVQLPATPLARPLLRARSTHPCAALHAAPATAPAAPTPSPRLPHPCRSSLPPPSPPASPPGGSAYPHEDGKNGKGLEGFGLTADMVDRRIAEALVRGGRGGAGRGGAGAGWMLWGGAGWLDGAGLAGWGWGGACSGRWTERAWPFLIAGRSICRCPLGACRRSTRRRPLLRRCEACMCNPPPCRAARTAARRVPAPF